MSTRPADLSTRSSTVLLDKKVLQTILNLAGNPNSALHSFEENHALQTSPVTVFLSTVVAFKKCYIFLIGSSLLY
jgi:hypothetical protein